MELDIGDTFWFKVYCNANATCYSKGWKLNVRQKPMHTIRIPHTVRKSSREGGVSWKSLSPSWGFLVVAFEFLRISAWDFTYHSPLDSSQRFKVCARIREVAFAKQVRKKHLDIAVTFLKFGSIKFAILHSKIVRHDIEKQTLSIVKLRRKLGTRLHLDKIWWIMMRCLEWKESRIIVFHGL